MISIHESQDPRHMRSGWLSPFNDDPKGWLVSQAMKLSDNLDELQWAMQLYSWSPSEFKEGRRSVENFVRAFYIGLDFDGGMTLDWAREEFKNYACIIGTTRSHQVYKDGVCSDRFRVMLRLSEVIYDADVFKRTAQHLIQKYNSDPACCDAARIFFKSKTIEFVGPEDGETIFPAPAPLPRVRTSSRYPPAKPEGRKGGKALVTLDLNGFSVGFRHEAILNACLTMHSHHKQMSFEDIFKHVRQRTDKSDAEIWKIILDTKGYAK